MHVRGMVAQLHLLLLLGSEVVLNVEPFADLLGRFALLDVLGNLCRHGKAVVGEKNALSVHVRWTVTEQRNGIAKSGGPFCR